MATIVNTTAHRAARNAASIALADTGSGVSVLKFYTADGGTLLAVRKLKKPCGTIVSNRIALAQSDNDDLVIASGGASWATWCDGDGVVISSGHVTDAEGNYTNDSNQVVEHPMGIGAFVLTGTTGTSLFAGGIVRLTTALIG